MSWDTLGMWCSLVARVIWDHEVASSSLVIPTRGRSPLGSCHSKTCRDTASVSAGSGVPLNTMNKQGRGSLGVSQRTPGA